MLDAGVGRSSSEPRLGIAIDTTGRCLAQAKQGSRLLSVFLVFAGLVPIAPAAAQVGADGFPVSPLHRILVQDDEQETFDQVIGKVNNDQAVFMQQYQSRNPTLAGNPPGRIIKHLRADAASYGKAFPSKEEIDVSSVPFKPGAHSMKEVSVAELLPGFHMGAPKRTVISDLSSLGPCRGGKVVQSPVASEPTGQEGVLYDSLFLRREDMPKDPDLTFGEREPDLFYYDPTNVALPFYIAAANGMTCLPFRIVVTGESRFLIYGDQVFKDYSKAKGKELGQPKAAKPDPAAGAKVE